MTLYDEPVNYDPTAELNPTIKIPDGTRLMELSLGKLGIKPRPKGGQPTYSVHLQGRIIAPGDKYDGYRVSGFIDSYVFANSGTSTVHQLLKAVGANTPPPGSPASALPAVIEQALAGLPQANVRTRWEASCKNSPGGSEPYVRLSGMTKFPQKADGTYSPFGVLTLSDGT